MQKGKLPLVILIASVLTIACFSSEQISLDYSFFQDHGTIMLIIDPVSGAIYDANDAAVDFYGYSHEELVSRTIQQVNTLTPSQVEQERLAAFREERNYFIFPHRLKSGEIKHVEVYSSPVLWSGKTMLFSIIHDISTRTQALEQVLEKERALSSFFQSSPLMMGIVVDHLFVELNDKALQLTGFTHDELIGKSPRVLFADEEDFDRMIASLQGDFEEGIETRWKRKDGTIIDVLLSTAFFDSKHPELGRTFAALDISNQKRSQQLILDQSRMIIFLSIAAIVILTVILLVLLRLFKKLRKTDLNLREEKERLQTLINAMPDAVCFKDGQGRWMITNPSNLKLFGLTLSESIGKTDNELAEICDPIHVSTFKACQQSDEEAWQKREMVKTIEKVHDWEKPSRVFEVTKVPLFNGNGKEVRKGLFVLARDVTQSENITMKLKQDKALLEMVEKLARIGGWTVDLSKNRVVWSDGVADIHKMPRGYSPTVEEGIGFYAPECQKRITEVFQKCAQEGVPYDEELQIITSRRERVWVRALGVPIYDESGKIVKVQGAFQDVSVQKASEATLIEAKEAAERSDRTKALFLANM